MGKIRFVGTNGVSVTPSVTIANRDTRTPDEIIKENATWAWHETPATDSTPAEWVLRSEPMKWFNPEEPSTPLQTTYALRKALEKQGTTFTIERGPNGDDLETQDDVRFVISNREPHIFAHQHHTANDIAKIVGLNESKLLAKIPRVTRDGIASHLRRGPKTCHNDPEMAAHAARLRALDEEREAATAAGTPTR